MATPRALLGVALLVCRATTALVVQNAALVSPPARPAARRRDVLTMGTYLETDPAGGLPYVKLTHKSGASATVYTLGADVTSYVDATGTEWIAVRPDAKMDGSKPISGGLSHCFPQFGPGPIQQHGFARNVDWDVVATGDSSVTFALTPTAVTKAIWDEPFECTFEVELTESKLSTTLTVACTGGDPAAGFDFQAALHSYFDVSSIGAVKVLGSFEGSTYLDKTASPPTETTEARKVITIAEEYDRVYKGVADPVLVDPAKNRKLNIVNAAGYKDTVIWSPYGNDAMGYDKFVCVESVAFDPVHVAPGAPWVGKMDLVPEAL